MPFDTVLLEFEGVLADTAAARRAALLRSLADDGIALSDADYERCCAGWGPREAAVAAASVTKAKVDDTALELIAMRADRYFAEAIGKGVTLAAGARGLVEDASGRSRLGIVTRASRREVDFVLGLAGLDAAFEVIVAREDVLNPKPAPEGYEKALQRLSQRKRISRPATSLALEDSKPGILAARAVKIPVIVVGNVVPPLGVQPDAAIPSLAGATYDGIAALVERPQTAA